MQENRVSKGVEESEFSLPKAGGMVAGAAYA